MIKPLVAFALSFILFCETALAIPAKQRAYDAKVKAKIEKVLDEELKSLSDVDNFVKSLEEHMQKSQVQIDKFRKMTKSQIHNDLELSYTQAKEALSDLPKKKRMGHPSKGFHRAQSRKYIDKVEANKILAKIKSLKKVLGELRSQSKEEFITGLESRFAKAQFDFNGLQKKIALNPKTDLSRSIASDKMILDNLKIMLTFSLVVWISFSLIFTPFLGFGGGFMAGTAAAVLVAVIGTLAILLLGLSLNVANRLSKKESN